MTHERTIVLWAAAGAWLIALSAITGTLLRRLGLVKPNFLAHPIPVGYGLLVLLWSAPVLSATALLNPPLRREYAAFVAVIAGMGILGFIDDLWGDRRRTGLKGHSRAFFIEGEITTGFLKAVGGIAIGVAVQRFLLLRSWPDALLDGAIIALSANALNLLDLRPGRACAVFLLLGFVVTAVQWSSGPLPLPALALILIPALVVYERDARALVMLGDSGSNLLGGALGLSCTTAFPSPTVRAALLAALILLHIVAERASLSKVIERNPILRRLDRLSGRRE